MQNSEAAGVSCDEQFHRTVTAIEKRLHLLGRLPQVRIKAWLAKLKLSTSNLTWKRNRNLYARLLLEQLRAGCLEVPFNTLPPQGSLPTLPAYLTYRFLSPPRPGQEQCDVVELSRPRSAEDSGRHRSALGSHETWTVGHSPSGSRPQRAPNAAGVYQNLSELSAVSPTRCGSPPRRGHMPGQEQVQCLGSPGSLKGSIKAVYPRSAVSLGAQVLSPQLSGSEAAWHSCYRVQQRPSSPAAAGLLDAAAALAAEVEADRGDTAMLENRLRYAEDKLLQQEAELVRLQSQAAAARRRLKAATASTLGDLVERYSSAAMAWGKPASPGGPADRQTGYGDAVYDPMWQLLSSMQQVLDTCDQQEYQWQQAQKGTAAAAIARFEAAQDQLAAQAGLLGGVGSAGLQRKLLQAAETATAAEIVVGKQLKELTKKLLQQAKHVVTAMESGKTAATSAAGGGSVSPAHVAAAAADALRAMMKSAKHLVNKDHHRLASQIDEAMESAAEVVAATSRLLRGSSSSDGGSSNSSKSSDSNSNDDASHAEQLQLHQQCKACLGRLQEARRLLSDLGSSTGKVLGQLSDGQTRLLDISNTGSSSYASNLLASHDRGLAAAATAGVTASLSAATSTYAARLKELKARWKSVSESALPGSHKAGGSSAAAQQLNLGRASSATVTFQQRNQQQPTLSRASSATHTPRAQPSWLSSPKQTDAALAGTFGSSALSSPRTTLSPLKTADIAAKGFNSVAHYLIGGAAASSGSLGTVPAAGVSKLLSSPPVSPQLSSLPASSSNLGISSAPTSNPAAETVHQRLASLSRQASRISERTSQILGVSNSTLASNTPTPEPLSAGSISSRLGAASPSLLSSGALLGGLESSSKTALRPTSLSVMPTSSLLSGGAGSLGGGLKSSIAAIQAPQFFSSSSLLSPATAGSGSLLSRGSTAAGTTVPRPASASPRLSTFPNSSVTSSLVGGLGKSSSLGGSSLAALSSRLSSLGKAPVLGAGSGK